MSRDEYTVHVNTVADWICTLCCGDLFPFNHVEDDLSFIDVIMDCCLGIKDYTMNIQEKIFMPFELDEFENNMPMLDIDPDLNFFTHINSDIFQSSKYYTEDSFNDLIMAKLQCDEYFAMIHLNIRSSAANLDNFINYLECLNTEFAIICLTETWLNETNYDLYEIPNYVHIGKQRSGKKGGGVSIYVKQTIKYKIRGDLNLTDHESEAVFIELDRDTSSLEQHILVGVIYRPPGTDVNQFNDITSDILERERQERKLCYLLGDYNIDLLKHGSHKPNSEFLDMLYGNSFYNLINRPTRNTQTSATLIDNIFTNDMSIKDEKLSGVLTTAITDHYPIFHIIKTNKPLKVEEFIMTRKYSEENKEKFITSSREVNWDDLIPTVNAQNAFTVSFNKLKGEYDKAFPIVKINKKYNNRKPWLSPSLRGSIKKKNKLYVKMHNRPTLHNTILYKQYRNKLNKILTNAERAHYNELFKKHKDNLQKTWRILKQIINKQKINKMNDTFRIKDKLSTNAVEICEHFNEFFINVGPTLSKNIPPQDCNASDFIERLDHTLYLFPTDAQ